MAKICSWLRKLLRPRKEAEEDKSIVQKCPSVWDEAPCYASINGGDAAEATDVPPAVIASRGSVTCPTCQGTGRIPRGRCHLQALASLCSDAFHHSNSQRGVVMMFCCRKEQEQQLVALIPYGDQRLKPRRTKLYVSLTVAICLLITCLMMYFLFPRSIAVIPAGLNASSISFDNSTFSIILNMTNMLNVTNNNFYTIRVAQLAIEVLHKTLVIGKNTVVAQLDIKPLQGAQILYTVSSRILDNNTYNICTWSRIKVHNVLLHIQGTLTCSYLAHSEQLSFEKYQYVDCRGNATLPGMSRFQSSLQLS